MTPKTNTVSKERANEIRLIRIYDAPVKTVWEAWVDPERAAKWWGPRGFTLTTHSKDLRPGGHWKYTMHGPDGKDWPNIATYHVVEKYKKLEYDHGATNDQPPMFHVMVLFSDLKGKTQMEMTMTLPTPEAAEKTRAFVKKAGGDSTWDRLAEYLEKNSSGKELFVINRAFNAPVETMFQIWTDPKHLGKWMAPAGFEAKYFRADIRPGGSSFYCMTDNKTAKMYGRIEYLEVSKTDRIVYVQQFCDENEKVTRHPMSPTWPESMLTTVLFTPEDEGRTRVTLTWEPYKTTSREEIETFVKARSGMTQGWTGSLDKLEAYLK